MLFLLFGSSAAGKTVTLDALGGRIPKLAVHDFDEIGVPAGADTAWRHHANEQWLRRALDYQDAGIDLLLAGQTPFGEMLAAPSASCLNSISGCLLDCDDPTRLTRLGERGQAWLDRTGGQLRDYLNWADWMRHHAADPSWRIDVIRDDATENVMRWSRWSSWKSGDPRWNVTTIDTTNLPAEQVADRVRDWIARERQLLRAGTHPFAWWASAGAEPG